MNFLHTSHNPYTDLLKSKPRTSALASRSAWPFIQTMMLKVNLSIPTTNRPTEVLSQTGKKGIKST